jgi:hypothetical protein
MQGVERGRAQQDGAVQGARGAVTTRLCGDRRPVVGGDLDGRDDIGHRRHLDDGGRLLVDLQLPGPARLVPAALAGSDHRARHPSAQVGEQGRAMRDAGRRQLLGPGVRMTGLSHAFTLAAGRCLRRCR